MYSYACHTVWYYCLMSLPPMPVNMGVYFRRAFVSLLVCWKERLSQGLDRTALHWPFIDMIVQMKPMGTIFAKTSAILMRITPTA